MALGNVSASVGGATKNLVVALDGSGNIAPAHVLVDSAGTEKGVAANPIATLSYPGLGIATNQVSVDTTSGGKLIVAARTGRRSVVIIQEGTNVVRIGASGVTMNNGIPLPGVQYASVEIEGGAAIYGIVASGSQTVSFLEVF